MRITLGLLLLSAATLAAAQDRTGPARAPRVVPLDGTGWRFRLAPDATAGSHANARKWMPAHVPGMVQTDLIALGKLPDPYVGRNEAAAQWPGLADWQYQTHVRADADLLARDHVDLVFDGLDTFATVRVNGVAVLTADNMFRGWRADVKRALHEGDNIVTVDFASPITRLAPYIAKQPYCLPGAYDSAFGDEKPGCNASAYIRKAGYGFGWDWGPRVVTAGIWKPVRIEAFDAIRAHDFHVAQTHLDDASATLSVEADVDADRSGQASLAIDVTGPDGSHQQLAQTVTLDTGRNHVALPLRIANPRRWWPVGYGRPDLYTVSTVVQQDGITIASDQRRIGLRTVEIRRDRDQWGRSFAFVVNGVPVFAKGANMIPFDMIPTRVTPAKQDRTLEAAVAANMNILRIWGGGTYQDDHVYEKADELGLMIWQDFMFGGSITPYDEAYRANVAEEAAQQVKRLRDHPSIVLWAGNNEVQTDWENWGGTTATVKKALSPEERDRLVSGMVRLFDRTLRDAVTRYAPGATYWASSPSTDYEGPADQDSDGDRHYWSVWGGKPVEDYLGVTPRFMSEFGLQSLPSMQTIRSFARPGDLSLDSPVLRAHQKYDKGNGNTRLLLYIHRNYGEPKDFADAVYLSQLMQADGIELAALHLRASRPRNMGVMFWQINDVWPGASWSSIDSLDRWKALQYRARRFYAPLAASLIHNNGVSEATILSDSTAPAAVTWRLRILDLNGRVLRDRSGQTTVPALSSTPALRLVDADWPRDVPPEQMQAVFDVSSGDRHARGIAYLRAAKDMGWPDPGLQTALTQEAGGYRLTITAAHAARGVWIDTGALDATLSDNSFDMIGGEQMAIHVATKASRADLARALRLTSYRAPNGTTIQR